MKRTRLRLSRSQWEMLRRGIATDQRVEHFAFGLASRAASESHGETYIVKQILSPDEGDLETQSAGYVRPSRKFQGLAYHMALDEGLSIIDFHTHTHGGAPHFSGIDDHHAERNAAYIAERFPETCRMGMVLLNQDATAFEGRVHDRQTQGFRSIERIEILGSPLSLIPEQLDLTRPESSRFERHLLIPGWSQGRLASLSIGLAGVGGTGALILQGLVGMGVGRRGGVIVCDPDRIEESNLPRLPYAGPRDVGKRKARTAASFFRGRERCVQIKPYACGVQAGCSRDALKAAQLLIGAVDSAGGRKILNEISVRYLIPYIDVGTEIVPEGEGKWDAVGQVRVVIPGVTGCLICCGGINADEAALDLLPRRLKHQRERMGYVRGTRETPTASVIYLNGILSYLALSHMAKVIFGEPILGHEHLYYSRNRDAVLAVGCKPDPGCPVCGPGGILAAGDPADEEVPDATPNEWLSFDASKEGVDGGRQAGR